MLVDGRQPTRDRLGAADDPELFEQIVQRDVRVQHGVVDLPHPQPPDGADQGKEIFLQRAGHGAGAGFAPRLLVGVGNVDVTRDAPVRAPRSDAPSSSALGVDLPVAQEPSSDVRFVLSGIQPCSPAQRSVLELLVSPATAIGGCGF